jgi:ABC-type antimicrobial peptide transport system permease subunit
MFSLHSAHDPRVLVDGVRKALAKMEPNVAATFLSTVDELLQRSLSGIIVVRRLLVEIAALGLLLSAVGIYGVIANLASERTQEIGIRMALGAQRNDVLWLFLRNGIRLATIGTGLGLLCSIGLMVALDKAMAIIPGKDPWVVVVVAVVLVVVAVLASWLPARRATAVNPIDALRAD